MVSGNEWRSLESQSQQPWPKVYNPETIKSLAQTRHLKTSCVALSEAALSEMSAPAALLHTGLSFSHSSLTFTSRNAWGGWRVFHVQCKSSTEWWMKINRYKSQVAEWESRVRCADSDSRGHLRFKRKKDEQKCDGRQKIFFFLQDCYQWGWGKCSGHLVLKPFGYQHRSAGLISTRSLWSSQMSGQGH